MPTTSNFGWTTPADTDLVKDGALAIRTLGNGIDTSMAELKGGTTGQVLSKTSNTDMDFTWVTTDDANAIQNAIVDAKGDLIAATANDTPARLAVGNNGETLVADSSATTGLRYQSGYNGNGFINGGLDIWQRGTSFANTSYAYSADRWMTFRGAFASGITTSRQSSGLTGIQYCARVARDSGNTSTQPLNFQTALETADSLRFAGQTVVVSFYARAGANYSSASSALNTTFYTGTGTDQSTANMTGGPWTGASNTASNVTLTTSWQRFSFTVTVGSSVTQVGFGAQYTPVGTAGANDYFEITGVQVELGSVATAFKRAGATLAGELAACQRYFERISSSASQLVLSGGYQQTTTVAWFTAPIVAKRTAPSLAFSGAGTPQIIYTGGSGVNATMGTVNAFAEKNSVSFYATAASAVLTTPNAAYLYASGGQVNIDASSEL